MPPHRDGRRIRTSKGFPRTWALLASRSGREKTIGGLGDIPTVRLPGSRSIPAPANENARLRGIGDAALRCAGVRVLPVTEFGEDPGFEERLHQRLPLSGKARVKIVRFP
jgi:hypothetical protein